MDHSVPMREFTDAKGVTWTVWSTVPGSRAGVPAHLHEGWLTFESGAARKRLSPIPSGWEEAAAPRLQLFLGAAESVTKSRRPDADEADSARDANPPEPSP